MANIERFVGEGEIDSTGKHFVGELEYKIGEIKKGHATHKKKACQLIAVQILNVIGVALITVGALFALYVLNISSSEIERLALMSIGFTVGGVALAVGLCKTVCLYIAQTELRDSINQKLNDLYLKYKQRCVIVKNEFVKENSFPQLEQEKIDQCISRLPSDNVRIKACYPPNTGDRERRLEYQVPVDYHVYPNGGRVEIFTRTTFTANTKRDNESFATNLSIEKEKYFAWMKLFRDLVINEESGKLTATELNCVLALTSPVSSPHEKPNHFKDERRNYVMDYQKREVTILALDQTPRSANTITIKNAEEMRKFLQTEFGIN